MRPLHVTPERKLESTEAAGDGIAIGQGLLIRSGVGGDGRASSPSILLPLPAAQGKEPGQRQGGVWGGNYLLLGSGPAPTAAAVAFQLRTPPP